MRPSVSVLAAPPPRRPAAPHAAGGPAGRAGPAGRRHCPLRLLHRLGVPHRARIRSRRFPADVSPSLSWIVLSPTCGSPSVLSGRPGARSLLLCLQRLPSAHICCPTCCPSPSPKRPEAPAATATPVGPARHPACRTRWQPRPGPAPAFRGSGRPAAAARRVKQAAAMPSCSLWPPCPPLGSQLAEVGRTVRRAEPALRSKDGRLCCSPRSVGTCLLRRRYHGWSVGTVGTNRIRHHSENEADAARLTQKIY